MSQPENETLPLSDVKRTLFGALGGIAPVLVGTINSKLDLVAFLSDLSLASGFFFRLILMMALGGFVSFLYRKSRDELTAFGIGIGAPGIIQGLVLGVGAQAATMLPVVESRIDREIGYSFVSTAFAGEPQTKTPPSSSEEPIDLCLPRRSTTMGILNGLVGASSPRSIDRYWLASPPMDDEQQAVDAYRAYGPLAEKEGMTPRIFRVRKGPNAQYVVVLDINLSARAAEKSDPRLWQFGKRPPVGIGPILLDTLLQRLQVLPTSLPVCPSPEFDYSVSNAFRKR